jgi:hypothetical protein
LVELLPDDYQKFLKQHSQSYQTTSDAIEKMVSEGIIITPPPIKKQILAEKKHIIRNYQNLLDVYNQWIEQNPDMEVIKIGAEPADYRDITTLYVKKAYPTIWTKEEYSKWASPNYPPYSPNNIAESELVFNDLFNDFMTTNTIKWFEHYSTLNYAHVIDFKTIMGINDKKLANEVSKITGVSVNDDVCEFINQYQETNKKLYFNHK